MGHGPQVGTPALDETKYKLKHWNGLLTLSRNVSTGGGSSLFVSETPSNDRHTPLNIEHIK